MADRKSGKLVVPQGGMMRDFVKRLKLIARLMGDSRVNGFVKLLPLASLAYLVFPFDLVPGIALPFIGALDDAAILWIGSTLFVELCPPNVVKEHMQELESNLDEGFTDEVVDAEATDLNDNRDR
ncbi:MAG TPA: YkvA family protein [Anaerolineales bacterium]|nr:YkvA family protein [Anaerolineales bacterium]